MHAHPSSSAHPQPPQPPHPQPTPPNIGQGQNNLFGTIMSGNGGPQGLVAPPQMSLDPTQQPPTNQTHPVAYTGPGGPPQSVPQSGGGGTAQSSYLNGGGPPSQLTQSQHAPKRQRLDDVPPPGPPQGGPLGIPGNAQQTPAGMYGSNGIQQSQNSQQAPTLGQGYNMVQNNKPGGKMSKVSKKKNYYYIHT